MRRDGWAVALAVALLAAAAPGVTGGADAPLPPPLADLQPRPEVDAIDLAAVDDRRMEEFLGPRGAGEVGKPVVVTFRDVALPTLPPSPEGPPAYHIQGEPPPDSSRGEAPVQPLVAKPAPPPTPPPGDLGATEAPGDGVRSWDALGHTGWIPPDTIHAVGPGHVVEAVNSGFAVYDKLGGTLLGYTTFSSFFTGEPTGFTGMLYDPRVVFTVAGGQNRFVMLVLGLDETHQFSFLVVAVSVTSDPTGDWWVWRLDQTNGNAGDSDAWADYCGLGADTWGVYATCNMFYFAGGFKYARLWSLPASWIYTGGGGSFWSAWNLQWNSGSGAFALQPANPTTTAGGGETFFVNSWSGTGQQLLLWKLTGDRAAPTLTRATMATTWDYDAIGNNVDQPGSATDIDGGDARVMNAVYHQRRVFTTLTDDVDSDTSMAGWHTFKLNVDSNAVEWEHILYSGSGFYYFYPALATHGDDGASTTDLALFGSWTTGSAQYASVLVKVYEDQPNTAAGAFVNTRSGEGAYVLLDGSGRNRWGDYSGAAYDWWCRNVWGSGEYARTSNRWGTQISAFTVGGEVPCHMLRVDDPDGGETFAAGTSTTVQWTRANTAGSLFVYFSPDAGATWNQQSGALSATATSWSWTLPEEATNLGRVFVGEWDGSAWKATDTSDADFNVQVFLLNGVARAGNLPAGAAQSRWDYYYFDLPAGTRLSTVEILGLSGDADLYVRKGSWPNLATYDCRPWVGGLGAETCLFSSGTAPPVSSGRWYVGVNNYATTSIDYTVRALWSTSISLFANGFEGGTLNAWSGHRP